MCVCSFRLLRLQVHQLSALAAAVLILSSSAFMLAGLVDDDHEVLFEQDEGPVIVDEAYTDDHLGGSLTTCCALTVAGLVCSP